MAAVQVSAAQAVGEYLQSPEDLVKISAFRKKLEKEKSSIDARLKVGVREQLEATKEGLRKLLSTRSNVQTIKDEMVMVERLCSDPAYRVPTFEQISSVSIVHRNFERTEEMVLNLLDMDDKVDTLEDMLDADRSDLLGPAPSLLSIHFQITKLENFRNQTLHQAKKASADSRAKLATRFERLNVLIEAFEEYVIALARNVLAVIRAGHPEVIVKVIKIAEMEGREDEKAIAIRLVKKAAKMDAASKFRSLQANSRQIKHYRSKMIKAITESIKEKFDAALAQDPNPNVFLEELGWIYQDLIRIEEDAVPCFPPEYQIYSLFVREYHKALNGTLKKIVADDPDATILLALNAWVKEYKKNMRELGISPDLLEPPLLDGKEQSLIDDYLNLIVKKLDEWSANLMKTEVLSFTRREEPPEIDADGLYGTQGAVILFQMVNQQCDLAIESGQGAILARVIANVNRVMRDMQARWTKVVDGEYAKQIEKPEEVPGGLVEYLVALANDQIKSADYAEALSGRLEALVSAKYSSTISEQLNAAIDGYLDVAKKCTQTLIDIIFNDLRPATKQLFQAAWYDDIMQQIVLTMRDYMADYQTYLNPSLLDLLIEDLVDTYLVAYLTALANAPKLRMPAATDRIKQDVSAAFAFFTTLKPAKEVEAYFEVVEMILAMLEASKSLVFLSYWQFAKVHGPNLQFVEGLMRTRSDLDRSAVNEVMESIKRKVKDENLTEPPEPTIMKKIALQSGFSRYLRVVS